jgi:hypothetical protein
MKDTLFSDAFEFEDEGLEYFIKLLFVVNGGYWPIREPRYIIHAASARRRMGEGGAAHSTVSVDSVPISQNLQTRAKGRQWWKVWQKTS